MVPHDIPISLHPGASTVLGTSVGGLPSRRGPLTTTRSCEDGSGRGSCPACLLLGRLLLLLRLDTLDVRLDLLVRQHLDGLPGSHDGDLDVLGARLHHLQQGFDGELNRLLAVHVVRVVSFEEFADCLARAANGVGFPTMVIRVVSVLK